MVLDIIPVMKLRVVTSEGTVAESNDLVNWKITTGTGGTWEFKFEHGTRDPLVSSLECIRCIRTTDEVPSLVAYCENEFGDEDSDRWARILDGFGKAQDGSYKQHGNLAISRAGNHKKASARKGKE